MNRRGNVARVDHRQRQHPATYLRDAVLANARGELVLPGDLAR